MSSRMAHTTPSQPKLEALTALGREEGQLCLLLALASMYPVTSHSPALGPGRGAPSSMLEALPVYLEQEPWAVGPWQWDLILDARSPRPLACLMVGWQSTQGH